MSQSWSFSFSPLLLFLLLSPTIFAVPVTITIFDDGNVNGIYEPESEIALVGVSISISSTPSGPSLYSNTSTTTPLSTTLVTGTYYLQVTGIPTNYDPSIIPSTPSLTSSILQNRSATFQVPSTSLDIYLGFQFNNKVGPFIIFEDVNGNGVFDEGFEVGLVDVPIEIYSNNGVFPPPVDNFVDDGGTDLAGRAWFDSFPVGEYILVVYLPIGFNFTQENKGNATVLGSSIDRTTYYYAGNGFAGYISITVGATGSDLIGIGMYGETSVGPIYVWNDLNRNGLQDDEFEPGIQRVQLTLIPADRKIIYLFFLPHLFFFFTAQKLTLVEETGDDGRAIFSGVDPGQWTLQVTPPTGFNFTVHNVGNGMYMLIFIVFMPNSY